MGNEGSVKMTFYSANILTTIKFSYMVKDGDDGHVFFFLTTAVVESN